MTKTHVLPWIKQLKDLLWICCTCLKTLKVGACVSVLAEFWMKTWWAAVYNMYIFTISFLLSVHTSACTSTTQMYTCIHVHLHVRAYVPIHAHMQAHTGKQTRTHTWTKKSHGYIFSLTRMYTHSQTHTSTCSVKLYFFCWSFLARSNISLIFPCTLQPENHTDLKAVMVHLRMLVTFTSTSNWKALRMKAGEWV